MSVKGEIMVKFAIISVAILCLLFPAAYGWATTIYIPADYPTIQEGMDVAYYGDTVIIKDGVYKGSGNRDLDFEGKAISVQSKNGPDNCIIDCEGLGRGFSFSSNEEKDSILKGVTIRNGSAGSGGGIYCRNASPSIINCVIIDNEANDDWAAGGGIYCRSASPRITDCTIAGNASANDGGGIYCRNASPTIAGCAISGNSATGDYTDGGGIFCHSSSPSISNCTITGNTVTGIASASGDNEARGGGISCWESSPIITDCVISGNSISGFWAHGGGFFVTDDASPIITNCLIQNNSVEGPYAAGGGMSCWNSSPCIYNADISGNSVTSLEIYCGDGAGIYCADHTTLFITDSSISNNSAYSVVESRGGGISCWESSPTINNCAIAENSVVSDTNEGFGGGVFCFKSSPTIINCPIIENTVKGNRAYGGGICCWQGSGPTITNCTVTGNKSSHKGGGMYSNDADAETANCIFWDNMADIADDEIYAGGDGHPEYTYCNIRGGWEGIGNIDTDPLFVSGPEGEYYLSQIDAGQGQDSPCLNAGSAFASNIRFVGAEGDVFLDALTTRTDEISDSGRVDMGFHYTITSTEIVSVSINSPDTDWQRGKTGIIRLNIRNRGDKKDLFVVIAVELNEQLLFYPTFAGQPNFIGATIPAAANMGPFEIVRIEDIRTGPFDLTWFAALTERNAPGDPGILSLDSISVAVGN